MKKSKKNFFNNQKGLVMLESLPIILVMFVLMGATLGSWGVVHTAILHSIAARNYIFFNFNNRFDLSYLRDFGRGYGLPDIVRRNGYYPRLGIRFSYIDSEKPKVGFDVRATLRFIDFKNPNNEFPNRTDFLSDSDHNRIHSLVPPLGRKNQKKVGPAWIMVGYGICLSTSCGD